jgi:branched-chain amino acid transport system ATP-binding protein
LGAASLDALHGTHRVVIVSLARRVVVFHQGKEIARGSPREVTANPAVIAAYLGTRAAKAAAGHTPIELMGGPVT